MGKSCRIAVNFRPDAAGLIMGTLTINEATPSGSQVIDLSGNGLNPVPKITELNPSSDAAGGPEFVITVYGSNLSDSSVVQWNGMNRSTAFVSSGQLQAQIFSSDISAQNTAYVTVMNPAPGGGASNKLPFAIKPPRSELAYSNDGAKKHPLYITTKNSNFVGSTIVADVVVTNVTGTWYELDLNSTSGDSSAPYPIPAQNIPFAFLIGPFQQITLPKVAFSQGYYLQLDATDTSLPATAIFGIDFITRALFGAKLNLSSLGLLQVSAGEVGLFLSAIQDNCSGPALAFGTATTIPGLIGKAADLAVCVANNPQVMQATTNLISLLYGSATAVNWQSVAVVGTEVSGFLFAFTHVSAVVALAEETLTSNHTGYVRIEARSY
jgi:hypothetical protein